MKAGGRSIAEESLVEVRAAAGTEEGKEENAEGREDGNNSDSADVKLPDELMDIAANRCVAATVAERTVDRTAEKR